METKYSNGIEAITMTREELEERLKAAKQAGTREHIIKGIEKNNRLNFIEQTALQTIFLGAAAGIYGYSQFLNTGDTGLMIVGGVVAGHGLLSLIASAIQTCLNNSDLKTALGKINEELINFFKGKRKSDLTQGEISVMNDIETRRI